jgi:hypothetical protein
MINALQIPLTGEPVATSVSNRGAEEVVADALGLTLTKPAPLPPPPQNFIARHWKMATRGRAGKRAAAEAEAGGNMASWSIWTVLLVCAVGSTGSALAQGEMRDRGPRMERGGGMGPGVGMGIAIGVDIIGNAIRQGADREMPSNPKTNAGPDKSNRKTAKKSEDEKARSSKEATPASQKPDEVALFGKPKRVAFDPDHRAGKLGENNDYQDVVVRRDGSYFTRHYFYMSAPGKVARYWWDDPLTADADKLKNVPNCEGGDDDCDGGLNGSSGALPPYIVEVDDKTGGGDAKTPSPKIAEGTPPTPVNGDPKDGIEVPGGKVHRGTMTIDRGGEKRTAITCWVEDDNSAACKNFQWYQWDCSILSIDRNDGKGLQKPKTQPAKAVETSTGSFLHFGKWGPDDYSSTRNKKLRKMFAGAKNNDCPEPKEPLKGGAYAGAQDIQIPGQPEVKPKTREVMERLIDAPNAAAAVDPVLQQVFGPHRGHGTEQPKDEPPITVEIVMYFRVALYCEDNCLGYFEWEETQKFKVTPHWKQVSDLGAETMGTQSKKQKPELDFELTYVAEKIGQFTPKIGAWQAPPC